jgi:hypothetical protein
VAPAAQELGDGRGVGGIRGGSGGPVGQLADGDSSQARDELIPQVSQALVAAPGQLVDSLVGGHVVSFDPFHGTPVPRRAGPDDQKSGVRLLL